MKNTAAIRCLSCLDESEGRHILEHNIEVELRGVVMQEFNVRFCRQFCGGRNAICAEASI